MSKHVIVVEIDNPTTEELLMISECFKTLSVLAEGCTLGLMYGDFKNPGDEFRVTLGEEVMIRRYPEADDPDAVLWVNFKPTTIKPKIVMEFNDNGEAIPYGMDRGEVIQGDL